MFGSKEFEFVEYPVTKMEILSVAHEMFNSSHLDKYKIFIFGPELYLLAPLVKVEKDFAKGMVRIAGSVSPTKECITHGIIVMNENGKILVTKKWNGGYPMPSRPGDTLNVFYTFDLS